VARSPTATIRFLTLDELARLLAVMRGHPRNRALFLIAYRHGLRASEVGLLRLEDLDFRALRLRIHRLKGSHSGVHPMQPDEAKALRAYLRERPVPPSPVLFPSNRGDPIARRTLDWLMKRYGEAADLPS
jgi:integrase